MSAAQPFANHVARECVASGAFCTQRCHGGYELHGSADQCVLRDRHSRLRRRSRCGMRHRRGPRAVPPLVSPSSSPAEHWRPGNRWQNASRGQVARNAGCDESQRAAIACAPPQEKPGYDARHNRVLYINGRVLACTQRMRRYSKPAGTAAPVLSHMRAFGECGRLMICIAAAFATATGERCIICTPVQARGRYSPTRESRNMPSLSPRISGSARVTLLGMTAAGATRARGAVGGRR